MPTRFSYNTTKFNYPDLTAHTAEDGVRIYSTPDGPAASVTTILSTLPHPALDAWKIRVGAEEAARVSKEALTIGSCMHNLLEAYIKDEPMKLAESDLEKIALQMFQPVRLLGLSKLEQVWGIEVAVHCHNLYAGRTDLIGVYEGKPSVIDYKTSIYRKQDEFIAGYKLQCAGYAVAHEEMFGSEGVLDQGVLLIGIRPNPPYSGATLQKVIIGKEELDLCKQKWMDVVVGFHGG